VDAGAHKGSWTGCLLDLFKPERVLALECEPILVQELRNRFRTATQVSVIDAALAASRGTAKFHRLQHPASSSLLQPRPEIGKEFQRRSWDVVGEISVNTIGYDELVASEQEVSILKLDIQGAEKTVLLNSESGLKKTKAIIIEMNFTPHYYDEGGFAELHQLLVQKGFGLYRLSYPYQHGGRSLFADGTYVREDLLQVELSE
jgi:FkbM family methyltransferase